MIFYIADWQTIGKFSIIQLRLSRLAHPLYDFLENEVTKEKCSFVWYSEQFFGLYSFVTISNIFFLTTYSPTLLLSLWLQCCWNFLHHFFLRKVSLSYREKRMSSPSGTFSDQSRVDSQLGYQKFFQVFELGPRQSRRARASRETRLRTSYFFLKVSTTSTTPVSSNISIEDLNNLWSCNSSFDAYSDFFQFLCVRLRHGGKVIKIVRVILRTDLNCWW